MKIAAAEQMREIDRRTIREYGIPGIILMEHAAIAVVNAILECLGEKRKSKILILAGKGNNGGDGFAIARLLHNRGMFVKVVFAGTTKEVQGDALINLQAARKLSIEILEQENIQQELLWADLVVDALYGTGVKGELRGPAVKMIQELNKMENAIPVVSVDIPSGVDADTGAVLGLAVKADITVTFALFKKGLVLYPGAEYAGKIIIADISIPKEVIESAKISVQALNHKEAAALLPQRPKRSNKGAFGKLYVAAGSRNMAGAAALCCRCAYRAGAGLVYACVAESIVPVLQTLIPEAVEISLREYEGKLSLDSLRDMGDAEKNATAFLLGPGMGRGQEVSELIETLYHRIKAPILLDADGLNAFEGKTERLRKKELSVIVTPHPGEMSRLTNMSVKEILSDTLCAAQNFARDYHVICVLKDARTVIAHPDGRTYINMTGNPAMAKAGSGDALSGMIGAFLAQSMDLFEAAILGVYVHGLAGDLAALHYGGRGVLASDLAEMVPQSLKELE